MKVNDRIVERREFLKGLTATAVVLASGLPAVTALAAPTRAPRRIDIHHHFVPPLFERSAREHDLLNPALNDLSVGRSIDEMDRNGVASAVLSIPSPGAWYGSVVLAQRIARDANECAARLISDHKGRFGMFATLTLPDLDSSLAEVAYAFDHLSADGIQMWTNYGDFWLGDSRLSPLLEELNRRKAVVYIHPATPNCCGHLLPEAPVPMIEYGTDTTRTIASLVLSGATNRYPDIRLDILSRRWDDAVLARSASYFRPPFSRKPPRGLTRSRTACCTNSSVYITTPLNPPMRTL